MLNIETNKEAFIDIRTCAPPPTYLLPSDGQIVQSSQVNTTGINFALPVELADCLTVFIRARYTLKILNEAPERFLRRVHIDACAPNDLLVLTHAGVAVPVIVVVVVVTIPTAAAAAAAAVAAATATFGFVKHIVARRTNIRRHR